MEIAVITEDVETAFRSALEVAEPKTKPWGQTVADVEDPDGLLVEFGSEV